MNQVQLIEKIWKSAFATLAIAVLAFGGLFANLSVASAQGTPNLTVRTLVSEIGGAGWASSVNTSSGKTVAFYVEIHNTNVGTRADGVTAKVNLPTGTSTSHNIPITISADNAGSVSSSVNVNITNPASGGTIKYVDGSSRLTWDFNGDGAKEFDMTPTTDEVATSGLKIGDLSGCNEFIIQLNFAAVIEGEDEPEPTPTPTPTPESTSSAVVGGQNQSQSQGQHQTQNNNQTNNQTVNVTNTAVPAVFGVKTPVKQPETGVGVLGIAAMSGAVPIGVLLSRYGRGRAIGKKEEELGQIATGLVSKRSSKTS